MAENGLADSISAFNTHYADTGLFGMTAVCDPANAQDLAWTMMCVTLASLFRYSRDHNLSLSLFHDHDRIIPGKAKYLEKKHQ